MFDPKLYREACGRMTLDAGKIEEMITMTENTSKKPNRRPARVALVAAALVAALGITAAAAAEIPAVQEFFTTIFVTVSTNDDGAKGFNIPSVAVQERDGRTILLVNGEETDVTDALAQSKEYLYEGDGFQVAVDENGVAVITAYGTDGTVVSFSTEGESEDHVVYEITTNTEEESAVTVTAVDNPEDVSWGTYHVTTDQNGAVVVKEAEE